MVQLETVVECSDVEYSSLASWGLLLELTNDDVRRQLKSASNGGREVVQTFGKLKNKVRPHKALTENHDRVPVNMEAVSQLEDIVLEGVDDTLCECVCIPFAALDKGFKNFVVSTLVWLFIVV